MRKWESASPLIAEAMCLELMAGVARREHGVERTPPRWLTVAREMLRDGGGRASVGAIAAECGVHPVHLARTFRRFFGCSPGEYLRQVRVERAAALLRRPNLSLAEVALRSGYADQSHLTHAFQSAFAITPSVYRRDAGIERLDLDSEVASLQDDSTNEL
jgi:AraC family transcriptional regulator